jgi:hypothetical protein
MTLLRRRCESGVHHKLARVAERFVRHLPSDFAETDVSDGASELVIPQHSGHIQIFQADGLVFAHQLRRDLMRPVVAQIRDALMQSGDLRLGLSPVLRPCA